MKKATEISEIKPNITVQKMLNTLTDSGKWKLTGIDQNAHYAIYSYVNSEDEIQIHVHSKGDLYGVFRKVREVNIRLLTAELIGAKPNPVHTAESIANKVVAEMTVNFSALPTQEMEDQITSWVLSLKKAVSLLRQAA